jgi:ApaG protein
VIDEFNGEQQEVRGLGVVGAQPLLQPGQLFEYTSGTVLTTPNGKMHGSYQMVADDGTAFDITVPAFTLSMPRVLH